MKTHSLISIICVVLVGKLNYKEWSGKIKYAHIFNDLWDGIYEREVDNSKEKFTLQTP